MTGRADRLAAEFEAVAHDVERIEALSRTQPHIFAEQKDALSRRLRKLAAELRNTFGGPAGQFVSGQMVVSHKGRQVRVVTRKAA